LSECSLKWKPSGPLHPPLIHSLGNQCVSGKSASRPSLSFMTRRYPSRFVYILQIVIINKLETRRVRVVVWALRGNGKSGPGCYRLLEIVKEIPFLLGFNWAITRDKVRLFNLYNAILIGPKYGQPKNVITSTVIF